MSFGIKVGRAIGKTAAFAAEGAIRGAIGAGQFSQDVLAGTQQGYAEQAAENLIAREAMKVAREKKLAALKTERALAALGEPVQINAPMVAVAP